jgi:hypothetical protein
MKKAVIIVKLVPENSDVSDGQIVKEIIAKIEKVSVSRNV